MINSVVIYFVFVCVDVFIVFEDWFGLSLIFFVIHLRFCWFAMVVLLVFRG